MSQTWEPITITVPEALKLSSLGRTFLYECLGNGTIDSFKRGKRRLIVYASLKQFLTSSTNEGSAK